MEVHLDPEIRKKLEERAREAGKPAEDLASELLKDLLVSSDQNGGSCASVRFHERETSLDQLIAEQGVKPAKFADLLGDFWPEDETADIFISAVHSWRAQR